MYYACNKLVCVIFCKHNLVWTKDLFMFNAFFAQNFWSRICKHKYCHCLEVLCTMRSIISRRCLKNTFWISYVFWVFTQQRLSNLKCFPFSQQVKVKGISILILFCEKGHNRLLKSLFSDYLWLNYWWCKNIYPLNIRKIGM